MAVRGQRIALSTRVRARLHGARLDDELARGADPGSRPELTARAAWLGGRRSRAALAEGLDHAVWAAVHSPRPWSASVEVERTAVRIARPELLALAATLRRDGAVHPRGVALTRRLLTDGSGPLFSGGPDALLAAAREALRNLEAGPSWT
jgi:hypothetical protein